MSCKHEQKSCTEQCLATSKQYKLPRKVKVYFNLHKKCFSVQDYKTRLVIDHVNKINLHDAEFRVSESGRQRVLREKRKNVHAFVVGYISESELENKKAVTYNPYKFKSFMAVNTDGLEPIFKADKVRLEVENKKGKIFVDTVN